nr:helix-turn-helix transcriptional regulator [Jiangella mangrovi]
MTGRHAERELLDQLVAAVTHAGESRALVIHGEAGVGKTALLDHLAAHAPGCRVVRGAGVQSEMELAFAGLHQLCGPLLDRLEHLPQPQADALRTVFGLRTGPAPDRFLVGLAVLGLLSEVAQERPLVCLVDDEQWLDHASAQVLAFVARRLGAESVGLVFAARVLSRDLDRLPALPLAGLPDDDARALLEGALAGPIDEHVCDQIVAETRGNPLALLELPRGLTVGEVAGGYGLPGAVASEGGLEETFRRRVEALPGRIRQLLVVAAADPTGDPALVCRAAGRLGIGPGAAAAAGDAGVAEFGTRVRFRHPLARSAVYRSASPEDRRAAHGALADATDEHVDPDRRAWHRAQAAPGPDEDVAAELERSAGRAQARGGFAAEGAFLKQSALLTQSPKRRAGRALAAAQALINAGAVDDVRDLLTMAESGRLDDGQQATVDLLRAQLAFVTSRGGDAPALLVTAARRLEPIDTGRARATYTDALLAAIFAGRLAGSGGSVLEVARAAGAAPRPQHPSRVPDLLLEGTAAGLHTGYAAGVPALRRALAGFPTDLTAGEQLRLMYLANITAVRLWDDEQWELLSARYLDLVRGTGALGELPLAITARAPALLLAGDLTGAAALTDELEAVKEATGSGIAPYGAMGLAALRGDTAEAADLVAATIDDATRRGEGIGLVFTGWAEALLYNGLGRFDEALAAGLRATAYDEDLAGLNWVLPELIEAAARCGTTAVASGACAQLAEMADATRTDWSLGTQARAQALLSTGEAAERLYREAVARFGRTRLRVDLARAHLLYGEWLRRERRRREAREQLRRAHDLFESMGATAFAERAWRELLATGVSARKRTVAERPEDLTAQETQIAVLARDGLSNPEIGTRLFLSPHTVQYHLRKVFAKLDVTSRSQLDRVLPSDPPVDSR